MAANNSDGNATDNNTNITNGTNVTAPDCRPYYCEHEVRTEALIACQEYQDLGIVSAESCRFWEDYAATQCLESCGNCTKIAREIQSSCLFLLQTVMAFSQAFPLCQKTEQDFRNYRCPSATIDKAKECFTDEARECNALCGNYNAAPGLLVEGCSCVALRTTFGSPDICWGTTVLDGPVEGRIGLVHSCRLTPDACKNHRSNTLCGYYKHCPVDVCMVKNVSCPPLDACQSDGVCASSDGVCYYQPKAEETECDDGLFYTHSTVCREGRCVGIANKCLRDDVECKTANSCLRVTDKTPGGCDPDTGSCIFEVLPDGTPCSSLAEPGAGGQTDGECRVGLCRRPTTTPPPCGENGTCPRPTQCYEELRCSSRAGVMCDQEPVLKPEGTPCDDGDANTRGDLCIEGVCIGDPIENALFHEFDSDSCWAKTSRSVRRYTADVPDLELCQAQCRADPECTYLSYGYRSCSIFGTTRQLDPDASFWGRTWLLQTAPARVHHDIECFRKTSDPPPQGEEAVRRALLALTIFVLLAVPILWFCAMLRGASAASAVSRWCSRSCRCHRTRTPKPKGILVRSQVAAAKVAALPPAQPAETETEPPPPPRELPIEDNCVDPQSEHEHVVDPQPEHEHVPDPRGEVRSLGLEDGQVPRG